MARIREALWKVDSAHAPRGDLTAAPCPAVTVAEPPAEEVEIPFIEVGGPHKLVEGSPSVMAPGNAAGKALAPRAAVHRAEAPATSEAAAKPHAAGVSFRPLHRLQPELLPAAQRFSQELTAFHQPEDPLSDQYRTLLRDLAAHASAAGPHAILIAAASSRHEPAATMLNIAVTRVREGKTCVVVDADPYEPKVTHLLGLPSSPGLQEVLSGSASLQRAVQETGLAGLHVLAAGKCPEEGGGLISSEAMRAVLRHLRMRFGWTLIKAPVWDGKPELVTLGSACDAAYLVLAEAESQEPRLQELLRIMPRQGIPLRGCIYTRQ
ncbi:MAG TPA: CpsD/CapB family tyrosine-protein kinase [Gemmataceae bacterium]|nr:CpsD/CapB family tyrosine-protein kinase [Gemmataceae bacterium]